MEFDSFQPASRSQTRRSLYSHESYQPITQLSGDDSANHPSASYRESLLLSIIGVVRHQKIPQLFMKRSLRESVRLGSGASFAVEEALLRISSTILQRPYRCRNATNVFQTRFTDPRGMPWAENSSVAHKKSSKPTNLDETFNELRVLCHGPLLDHPNIVRLLGVAWYIDQDAEESDSAPGLDSTKSLDSPVLLTEKAPHGSLDQFLSSDTRRRISLRTKMKLCLDVLVGLLVSILDGGISTP